MLTPQTAEAIDSKISETISKHAKRTIKKVLIKFWPEFKARKNI